MKKIVLTFGLIAGAILSAMMLVTIPFADDTHFDNGLIIGYATMVLAFTLIYFGVRSYRDRVAGGQVTFFRAFLVGLSIMAVASACYVATWEVIYYKFAPDYMEKYTAHTLEQAKRSGASEAELKEKAKQMAEFGEMYKNPLINVAMTFLEPLPVGLVFALVTAGVLGRKRKIDKPAVA